MPASLSMTTSTVFLDSPEAICQHLRHGIPWEDFDVPGVRFIACDEHNEVRAHFHVAETPPEATFDDCAFLTSVFVEGMSGSGPDNALLVALTRRGAPTLTPADRRWFRAVHQVCAEHRLRLLGVHVVTPRGSREMVLDDVI
jgi:hypothetical protein